MAQLARCPHCYTELELPAEVAEGDRANMWVKCPACEDSFAVADAKPRTVKQAQLSVAPSKPAAESQFEPAEDSSPVESTTSEDSASGLSDSLLESFLQDDAPTEEFAAGETTEPAASDQPPEGSSLPSLGDLKSLEDLFRGGKEPVEMPMSDAESSDFASKETIDLEEPSPAADRRRPTLGELFAESDAPSTTADSGSYDPVEEAADDQSSGELASADESLTENKQTAAEFDELTLHDFAAPSFDTETTSDTETMSTNDTVPLRAGDSPSFDQSSGEPAFDDSSDELDESKSLRASMGFPAIDDSLEVQDEENEPAGIAVGGDEDELNFAGVDAPRGVVATRKRKSSFSAIRTVLGIVFGGMVGLYAGYLVILWIKVTDPLNAANLYPDAIKPQALRATVAASAGPDTSLAGEAGTSNDYEEAVTDEPSSDIDLATAETPLIDDEEPMPWEFEAAPAQPPTTNLPSAEVTILDAPQYTAAAIQRHTTTAEQAVPDLLAPGPPTTSKGTSYALLAQLADALTFGEGAADASWNSDARQLFPPLFATPEAREQISQIGGYWLTHPTRKHGGIFFCGTPDAGRQAGSVAEYQFTLPGGQSLTVLTPQTLPASVSSAQAVVVVGSVIDNAADRIEGYTGTASQVIWSENVLPAGN